MAAERGRIEPAPRRVRGYFANNPVFDTTRAQYVWEVPYYPQYYIPVSDVRMELLQDEDHPQMLQLGSSRLHSLTAAGRTHKSAARVFDSDGGFGTGLWSRDENEWVVKMQQVLPDGGLGSMTNVYEMVDGNTYRWRSIDRHVGDSPLPNVGPVRIVRKSSGVASRSAEPTTKD